MRTGVAAQPWVERAERFRERIIETPQIIRDWVRNAAFSLVAGIFQAVADVYLNQAEALRTEAETLRDGADAKEQQAAARDFEAAQLLIAADQALSNAENLHTEAAELIAQAEATEVKAAEYRYLAENPPETKETTVFVYNLTGQIFGEYSETGDAIREYVWLSDLPVAMIQENETFYVHNNHLETPQKLTDQNQQIAWNATYDPFGTANITVERVTNNLRFPGQYFDAEIGLHYNYFRYYDPETGRYMTSDPIGLLGGINTYVYATNSPLNFTDRFGLANDCSFYGKRCEQVPDSEYYCKVAPFVCENWPDDPWDWDGCVRKCLQDKDCPADPCGGADLTCITKIHAECWTECL